MKAHELKLKRLAIDFSFWRSNPSCDLFGQELSTNAANYYNMGIKGRYNESKIQDDHQLYDSAYSVMECKDDKISMADG